MKREVTEELLDKIFEFADACVDLDHVYRPGFNFSKEERRKRIDNKTMLMIELLRFIEKNTD